MRSQVQFTGQKDRPTKDRHLKNGTEMCGTGSTTTTTMSTTTSTTMSTTTTTMSTTTTTHCHQVNHLGMDQLFSPSCTKQSAEILILTELQHFQNGSLSYLTFLCPNTSLILNPYLSNHGSNQSLILWEMLALEISFMDNFSAMISCATRTKSTQESFLFVQSSFLNPKK